MKTVMTRTVNTKVRYYSFELLPNLFGEWMMIRTYGALKRLKPTGVIKEIYTNAHEATISMQSMMELKKKRGYAVVC